MTRAWLGVLTPELCAVSSLSRRGCRAWRVALLRWVPDYVAPASRALAAVREDHGPRVVEDDLLGDPAEVAKGLLKALEHRVEPLVRPATLGAHALYINAALCKPGPKGNGSRSSRARRPTPVRPLKGAPQLPPQLPPRRPSLPMLCYY
jgi:hypothetical protein